MSTSIKLDNNLDIIFRDGMAQLVTGIDDVVQAIRVELEQNRGQWELNIDYGTPYLNESNTGILQQKDIEQIKKAIFEVIIKYKQVEKINKLEYINDNFKIEVTIAGERREIV